MPDFTIHLSHQAVARLQAIVQRANETNGTSLTLRAWLQLHAEELAIADDLAAAVNALQQQEEAAARDRLQAAIRATRDQLLQEL
jgi:predicted hotdog family 3-hydroxylacyl-ACP dehydratase